MRWSLALGLSVLQVLWSIGPGAVEALAQVNVRAQAPAPVVPVTPVPTGAMAPLAAPSLGGLPTLSVPQPVSVLPTLPSPVLSAAPVAAKIQTRAAAPALPVAAKAQAGSDVKEVRFLPAETERTEHLTPTQAAEMPSETAKGASEQTFYSLIGRRLIEGTGDVSAPAAVRGASLSGRSLLAAPKGRPAQVKPEPASPAPTAKPSFWSKPVVRLSALALGALAAAAAAPLLVGHAGIVAAVGSAALTVIGIPQIVKNHRGGQETVKDLVIASPLIWFAAATLLSVASIGQGASLWWNLANVAGVLESAVVVGQINWFKRDRDELKATAAVGAAMAAVVGLVAASAFMPLTAWLDLSFTAAMALLWVLNAPQIRLNHKVWTAEGRVAQGIAPLYPALVAGGSLLHLFTAVVTGDARWAINALIGILTAGIVLGQIYAPKATNAALGPLIRVIERAFARFAPSPVSSALRGADLGRFAGKDADVQVEAVVARAKALPGRSVIFLAAPTAAGKSTLAKALEAALPGRLRALELDRYYGDAADAPRDAKGRPDFDRPEALRLRRAAADIRALSAGETVELPAYDMATGRSTARSGETMTLGADDVLIVDSLFASRPELLAAARGRASLNVYLDAPAVVRLARRLARDKNERGRPVAGNLASWAQILDNEARYILPLKKEADAVLNLVSAGELEGLRAAYEKLSAEEADPAVRALLADMIRASLKADRAIASPRPVLNGVTEGRGRQVSGRERPLDLSGFERVVFDVRGSRGGHGDVAAGYLTAADLIDRALAQGEAPPAVAFVADAEERRILSRLTGAAVSDGAAILGGYARVHQADTLPAEPADLYLSLAASDGDASAASDLPGARGSVVLNQTVLGNTETEFGSLATVRSGKRVLELRTAGLRPGESGVYADPVARRLRGAPEDVVRRFVAEELGPDARDGQAVLRAAMEGKVLEGAQPALAYGVSLKEVKPQLKGYLSGLAARAGADGESFLLVTPSAVTLQDIKRFKGRVVLVDPSRPLPKDARPGVVYVLKTGTLPHAVFIALMALARPPPIVSGDGAMSAALALARPFVLTRVDWNAANIDAYSRRLESLAPDKSSRDLIRSVFRKTKLQYAQSLEGLEDVFAAVSAEIPVLTDGLIRAARAAWGLADDVPAAELVKGIDDPVLRMSLLAQRALDGDQSARRLAERELDEAGRQRSVLAGVALRAAARRLRNWRWVGGLSLGPLAAPAAKLLFRLKS